MKLFLRSGSDTPPRPRRLFIYAPHPLRVAGDYVRQAARCSSTERRAFQTGTPAQHGDRSSVCGTAPHSAARSDASRGNARLEAVEGMMVEYQQTLTVSEVETGRYASAAVCRRAACSRPTTPHGDTAGSRGEALAASARRRPRLQNPYQRPPLGC